jgi:uncharacterized protein YjcR
MRLQQRQSDFNKINNEIRALKGINDVDERFIIRASKFWWAHRIAMEYGISPLEVKKWSAEDIMETLAAIGMAEKNSKKAASKGG